jgi:L-ribulose-5-phosphate 3-epimerase
MKFSGEATLFSSMAPVFSFPRSGGLNPGTPHISIFSKHLQWLGYKEMAILAREMGFTGIDLTVREGGHVEPENAGRDLPEAVNTIRKEGMEVPMITTGITDPEDPLTLRILESAGKLGIPVYRTGWFIYRQGTRVQDQLKEAAEQLRKLQDLNRTLHIAASYQNHSGDYIGSSCWDLAKIIEGLDPRWVGVQFDIRHAMVEGPERALYQC